MYKTQTAPMGWNSWDCYGAAVTEDIVRQNAAFMAEHLKQYGWEYITVDIQWAEPTAENHEYHPFTELCMDEYSRQSTVFLPQQMEKALRLLQNTSTLLG